MFRTSISLFLQHSIINCTQKARGLNCAGLLLLTNVFLIYLDFKYCYCHVKNKNYIPKVYLRHFNLEIRNKQL